VGFLIDLPLSPALAAWLREQELDAVHAAEIGLGHAPDADIMVLAKQDHQTIVTAGFDYQLLLALARTTPSSVILFREGDWSEADIIARMEGILRVLTEAEIAQSIIVVDRDRVRRRRLPIL
jgi:predicted nuclease of predicted toxin-antitoxin system